MGCRSDVRLTPCCLAACLHPGLPAVARGAVIKMFQPFGPIAHVEYMWHTNGPRRGEPRGFAFVEYVRREDAEKAIAAMNNKVVMGRALIVNFASERVRRAVMASVALGCQANAWRRQAKSGAGADGFAERPRAAVAQELYGAGARLPKAHGRVAEGSGAGDARTADGHLHPPCVRARGCGGRVRLRHTASSRSS